MSTNVNELSTIICATCRKSIPAAKAVYSRQGAQVCPDCEMAQSMRRNELQATVNQGARGGLLDKVFLSKMHPSKHKYYWLGQVLGAALLVAGMMYVNMDIEDMFVPLMGGLLAIIVVWGTLCTVVFRFDPNEVE